MPTRGRPGSYRWGFQDGEWSGSMLLVSLWYQVDPWKKQAERCSKQQHESLHMVGRPLLTSTVTSIYWLLWISGSLNCGATVTNAHIRSLPKMFCLCWSLGTFLHIWFKSVRSPCYLEYNLLVLLWDVTQLDESCFGTLFVPRGKVKKKKKSMQLACVLFVSLRLLLEARSPSCDTEFPVTRRDYWKPWVMGIWKVMKVQSKRHMSCRDAGCEWREEAGGGCDAEGAE